MPPAQLASGPGSALHLQSLECYRQPLVPLPVEWLAPHHPHLAWSQLRPANVLGELPELLAGCPGEAGLQLASRQAPRATASRGGFGTPGSAAAARPRAREARACGLVHPRLLWLLLRLVAPLGLLAGRIP